MARAREAQTARPVPHPRPDVKLRLVEVVDERAAREVARILARLLFAPGKK